MKRIFIILLLTFVAAIGFCSGIDNAGLYSEANKHYAAGEYEKALNLYKQLIERGINNHSLYYNTANAYFKLGDTGHARLFYERALLLNPFDRDVRNNLEFLKNSMQERIVPLYNEGFVRALYSFYTFMTLRILVFIELFFFTLFVIVIHLYLLIPGIRDRIKRLVYSSIALFFIFLVTVFSYNSYEKNHPKGVVIEKRIEVLGAPVAESEVLFTLYEATKLKLRETRGDWLRITIADGREGWIHTDFIEFI